MGALDEFLSGSETKSEKTTGKEPSWQIPASVQKKRDESAVADLQAALTQEQANLNSSDADARRRAADNVRQIQAELKALTKTQSTSFANAFSSA